MTKSGRDSGRAALGIDLGGTKIAAAVATEAGEIISEARAETGAEEGPDSVVARIADVGRDALAGAKSGGRRLANTIGVGVAGQLDRERQNVLSAPNLPGWSDFPLARALSERLDGRSVRLENDANVAAVAEHRFGAGTEVDDLILLTVGTGVGGGIIQSGRLVVGAHGWGGELGHLILEPTGPMCGMGHRGCLESLSSGTAIARAARERLSSPGTRHLTDLVDAKGDRVTAELVQEAAEAGDSVSRELFERAGRYLGIAIAGLVLCLDPAVVVVGGSVVRAGEMLLGPARESAREALFPAGREALRIVPTQLEGRAGVLGAAFLALSEDS